MSFLNWLRGIELRKALLAGVVVFLYCLMTLVLISIILAMFGVYE